jgi:predicted dehydrogenase
MDNGEVRIGVLGLGAIAQVVHLPILTQLPNARVVAVSDADGPKAASLASRFGIDRVYDNDDDIFRADDIDGLVICTPSHLHEQQAIAALESGKHVLVEKPLALGADEARRVVDAAEKAGRKVFVAMNNRYRPDAQALKPFVTGGELGDIFLGRGAWLNRKVRTVRPTWRHRRATAGGGALMDIGVQTLDLCLWILNFPRIQSVSCHTHAGEGMEVEDSAAMLLRLANGAALTLTVSWSLVAGRDRQYMRFLGSRGSAAINPLTVFKEVEHGLLDVTPNLPPGNENLYTASYRQELEHFVRVVAGQADSPLPEEQIEVMRIISLLYQSAREKREIEA